MSITYQNACATGTRLLIEYHIPELVCHWNTASYSISYTRTRIQLEHGFLLNIIYQNSRDTGTRLFNEYNMPELVCHWNTAAYSIQHFLTSVPLEHRNLLIIHSGLLWHNSEAFHSKSHYQLLFAVKRPVY